MYDAHPHIGTNKLPAIITAMRKQILDCGGEFHFEKKVIDFVIEKDKIKAVKTSDGDILKAILLSLPQAILQEIFLYCLIKKI